MLMKHPSLIILSASAFLLFPLVASAHEHRVFQIGDKQYSIIVGTLNEPATVDDRSGIEVSVQELGKASGAASDDGPSGTPVEGLAGTLKVEVSAGDQKKTFELEPKDEQPGWYGAVFHPTIQTTYSYRLTGTINKVPIDVTYTCNPAGHVVSEEDKNPIKISDNVTQTLKGGAFGCPIAKEETYFPQKADSMADLTAKMDTMENAQKGINYGWIGFVTGIVGMALGIIALARTRKRPMI